MEECKVKFHAHIFFTVISLCKTICEFLMRLTLRIIAGNTMPTFPKFNMEADNDTLEKEILFGNHPFQVRCQTSGGYSYDTWICLTLCFPGSDIELQLWHTLTIWCELWIKLVLSMYLNKIPQLCDCIMLSSQTINPYPTWALTFHTFN